MFKNKLLPSISLISSLIITLTIEDMTTEGLIAITVICTALIFMLLEILISFIERIKLFKESFSTDSLNNIQTSKIHSAEQGYIELSGIQGSLDKPLISPLTKSECIWFRYRILKIPKSYNGHYLKVIRQITSHDLFKLSDETGECLIDPKGARIKADCVTVKMSKTPDYSEEVDTFIDKLRFWRRIDAHYMHEEEILEVGSPLYAMGTFKTLDNSLLIEKYQNNKKQSVVTKEWLKNLDASKRTHLVTKPGKAQKKPYILSIKSEQKIISDKPQNALYASSKAPCGLVFFIFLAFLISFTLIMIRSFL